MAALATLVEYHDIITGETNKVPLSNTFLGVFLKSTLDAREGGITADWVLPIASNYSTSKFISNYNWDDMSWEQRANFFDKHMIYYALANGLVAQSLYNRYYSTPNPKIDINKYPYNYNLFYGKVLR